METGVGDSCFVGTFFHVGDSGFVGTTPFSTLVTQIQFQQTVRKLSSSTLFVSTNLNTSDQFKQYLTQGCLLVHYLSRQHVAYGSTKCI